MDRRTFLKFTGAAAVGAFIPSHKPSPQPQFMPIEKGETVKLLVLDTVEPSRFEYVQMSYVKDPVCPLCEIGHKAVKRC